MGTIKVMVSLPAELLAEMDHVAKEEHRSRSALLREAARQYIDRRGHAVPGDDPQVRSAHEAMLELARRLGTGSGPTSVELVRQWRDRRQSSPEIE